MHFAWIFSAIKTLVAVEQAQEKGKKFPEYLLVIGDKEGADYVATAEVVLEAIN